MKIAIEVILIILLFSLLLYEHKSYTPRDSYAKTKDSKIVRMLNSNDETPQKAPEDKRYIYSNK